MNFTNLVRRLGHSQAVRRTRRLGVELLEDRVQPATGEPVAVAGAASYWADDRSIVLDTRANEVVVGVADGSGAVGSLTATGGPLEGMSVTRWLTPSLAILRDPGPISANPTATLAARIGGAAAASGVTFAAPVYQNPETGGWLVATNELIVALAPGADPRAALADPRFAGWEPLSGTPDQFIVRAAAGYGPAALALDSQLRSDPDFRWTAPNWYQGFEKFFTPNDPSYPAQWHLNNTGQQSGSVADADIDAPEAWDVTQGSQHVIVSVVDDGMEITHPDLAPNIAINQNEIPAAIRAALTDVDGDGIISFRDLNNAVNIGPGKITDLNGNGRIDPDDILRTTANGGWSDGADGDGNGYIDDLVGWDFTTNGTTGDNNPGANSTSDAHATSVAGVAVGVGNNGLGTTGAAFNSRMLAVRIFGASGGATTDANIASAVYYAAGRTRNGLGTFRSGDIMNNSWGGGSFSNAIRDAFQWASTNGRGGLGTASFISSGNDGVSSIAFPSNLAGTIGGVISVGSSTNTDVRAGYSQYGPQLDFLAPSSGGTFGVVTVDRVGSNGYHSGDYTLGGNFGGTSSASPLAAGVGALVLSMDLNLTAAQIRGLMRNTTDYIGPGSVVYDPTTGFTAQYGYGRVNANAAVRGVGVTEIQVLDGRTNVPDNSGSVNLGSAPVGGTPVLRTFRVRNQGTLPLTLGAPTFTGPFALQANFGSTTLAVGQSTTFVVAFSPTAAGAASGTVSFATNDADEGTFNFALTGTGTITNAVTGQVVNDLNGNGARDGGEPGVGGWRVFDDRDNNGVLNGTEASVLTDSSGNYILSGLVVGATTIRIVPQAGFRTTLGANGLGVTIVAGATLSGRDFGVFADAIAPTADVLDVTPDPRYTGTGSVTIVFSEPVTGFALADLTLTRNGGANLLTASQTLTTADSITWTLGNLSGITAAPGAYVLTVIGGAGIQDLAQNPLAGNATDGWQVVPPPTLSISDVTVTEGDSGTATATFTVSLSSPALETVSVSFTTANGTATTADGDFAATSGTVTFAAGEQTQTVTVQVNGDTKNEADETFFVNLSGPTNGVIGDGQGKGTITNDDPVPTVSIADVTLAEGDSGATNFTFTVNLSAISGQTVTVGFATSDGTATTTDGDYTATSGTVTFAPGTGSRTITVLVTGDTRNEIDETFGVTLSGPTNATIATGTATGTITNDDSAPTIGIGDVTVFEGNAGTTAFIFTVSLSAVSGQTVTVDFATSDGTATTADGDYIASSGTLTFAPGVTSQDVTILVNGDTKFELNEAFAVILSGPTNATIATDTAAGTIVNEDVEPSVTLSLAGDPIGEGGGVGTVTATLTNASYLPVTVTLDYGGSASASDYAAGTSIVIPAGSLTGSVTITGLDDADDENDEAIIADIAAVSNGTEAGTQRVIATLVDDDLPVAVGDGGAILEDGTLANTTPGALLMNDNAAPGAMVEAFGPGPANGSLILNPSGTFTYTPNANFNGTDTFQYRVRNTAGEVSQPATVTITVTPVNDAPSFVAGPDQVIRRRGGAQAVPGWASLIAAGPANEAGQGLSFLVTTDNPALFLVAPAIDPATGMLTYTPTSGFGTANVMVRLKDDAGTADGGFDVSPERTFRITVTKYQDDDTPTNQNEVLRFAAGSGDTGASAVYEGNGATALRSTPFGEGGTVGARTATADVTGDGIPDLIAATGPGVRARVVIYDGKTNAVVRTLLPFEDSFQGGLFVAAADIDGDRAADIAVSPDVGGGGRVTVFSGRTGGIVADFFGIDDPNFRGGARVTFGDLDNSGIPELFVAAGFGGGPRIAVFDGASLVGTPSRLIGDFFGFPGKDVETLRNGAFVSAGDVDGDGFADLALGGGPGGAPRVFVLSGKRLLDGDVAGTQAAPIANFFVANDATNFGGVRVAVKDLDGDDRSDLVVGSGDGVSSRVRAYLGKSLGGDGEPAASLDLDPFGELLQGGVFVG